MAELAKIDFEPLVRSAEHIQAENEEAALGYWQDAWIQVN